MATKKEIFEKVTGDVNELCTKYKATKEFVGALSVILSTHLEPKNGGAVVNIDEVTKKDKDGKITHILCSVSEKFLPATKDFFYEDKAGKGLGDTGLKRLSRQAESIRKKYIKTLSATEKAIMADVLDGKLTPEIGKSKIEKAKAAKPDYSKVSDVLPSEDDEDIEE